MSVTSWTCVMKPVLCKCSESVVWDCLSWETTPNAPKSSLNTSFLPLYIKHCQVELRWKVTEKHLLKTPDCSLRGLSTLLSLYSFHPKELFLWAWSWDLLATLNYFSWMHVFVLLVVHCNFAFYVIEAYKSKSYRVVVFLCVLLQRVPREQNKLCWACISVRANKNQLCWVMKSSAHIH